MRKKIRNAISYMGAFLFIFGILQLLVSLFFDPWHIAIVFISSLLTVIVIRNHFTPPCPSKKY